MNTLLNNYFDYLLNEKKSSVNTFASYKRDILGYAEYLKSINCSSVTDAGTTLILNYLLLIQQQGKSNATASRILSSIRSLYKFLQQKGYISVNPTISLHNFKTEKKLPMWLSDLQVDILLDTPVCRNIKGYRDKAMLEILYATGIKATELINLRISDVNLKIGFIYSRSNGKEHIIPIYAYARDCVQEYMEKRKQISNSDKTDVLFLNRDGQPLSRQGLWKIIKTYQKKSGLPEGVTPHTLRHSFAVNLLENGADLKSVQEMLGHTNIASTQIYERVINNKLSEVYANSHPRSKLHK